MSAVTAAFLETGQKGYGAATPPEAASGFIESLNRNPIPLSRKNYTLNLPRDRSGQPGQ